MTGNGKKFSPLTPEEMNGGGAGKATDTGDLVLPVPDNMPELVPSWKGWAFGGKWEYRNSSGELMFVAVRFDNPDVAGEKDVIPFTARRVGKNVKWVAKSIPSDRPLFNCDHIAALPDAIVVVAEGEKTAVAAAQIYPQPDYVCTTSSGGGKAVDKSDWTVLANRKVIIAPDNDKPGAKYAGDVSSKLEAIGCNVTRINIEAIAKASPKASEARDVTGYDLFDALEEFSGDVETLRSLCGNGAKPLTLNPADEVDRLAMLDEYAYETERSAVAKALGWRATALDSMVKRKRSEFGTAPTTVQQRLTEDDELWHEPVNPAELLDTIKSTVKRYIVCSDETATATALWVVFTWVIEHVHVAPIAMITAPEKRCGKTQLLDVIGRMSCRPLVSSNISSSAFFRTIDAERPTLLTDEADTFVAGNEELRGVINSGHTRQSAFTIRTVGENFVPTRFSTWCAKAISGIGKLPDTIMDRSIILSLRRKVPGENVERLRHASTEEVFAPIRSRCARFANDFGHIISASRPALPETLSDRAQDNWEPLLCIAEVAGEAWTKSAHQAAVKLAGVVEEPSANEELLSDIRDIFERQPARSVNGGEPERRMHMKNLLQELVDDEEAPWATWNRGRPMSIRQLSARLKDFGIFAKAVKVNGENQKGFVESQLTDAFARYLSGGKPAPETAAQPATDVEEPGEYREFL